MLSIHIFLTLVRTFAAALVFRPNIFDVSKLQLSFIEWKVDGHCLLDI